MTGLTDDAHVDFDGGPAKGGRARIMAVALDAVTLRSTVPSPPGSRIEGMLRDGGDRVRFKVHASKKQEDGTFVLEGRAIDLTRALRERLVALARPA
jgi:hypothetical protein